MTMLPLHNLLDVPPDCVLVVDNARSPQNALSMKKRHVPRRPATKRSVSWDGSQSRWASIPAEKTEQEPLPIERHTRRLDAPTSNAVNSFPICGLSGEIGRLGMGPRLPRRVVSPPTSPSGRKIVHRSSSYPLRQPVRQMSRESLDVEKRSPLKAFIKHEKTSLFSLQAVDRDSLLLSPPMRKPSPDSPRRLASLSIAKENGERLTTSQLLDAAMEVIL